MCLFLGARLGLSLALNPGLGARRRLRPGAVATAVTQLVTVAVASLGLRRRRLRPSAVATAVTQLVTVAGLVR